jgi:hypothetical protein
MEVASNHCRDGSLSSFGSLYSADIDLSIDEIIEPDCSTRPGRQRLGAEMAIIASTSPEIKALNLPSTPIFPQGMESFHHRRNSSGTFSSCSSTSSAGSRRRGTLSPLLAAMDDVECSPESRVKAEQYAMHVDKTDEVVRPFSTSSVPKKRQPKNNEKKHVWFDDKENIHPNLFQNKDHGKKPLGFHSSSHPYRQSKVHQHPSTHRQSLHRRGSLANLPSPGEIGLPKTVRTIPFLPSDMNQLRSDHRRRAIKVPKSLSLVTGFR